MLLKDDSVVRLFANCIPVRGARRSIVCDLYYQTYMFIPNILYEILTTYPDKSVQEIKDIYDNRQDAHIDEYFSEILRRDLGFICEKKDIPHFPPLDLLWERPEAITNSIIDLDPTRPYDVRKVALELDSVGCKAVQVRIFPEIEPGFLVSVLEAFEFTRIEHIELLLKYSDALPEDELIKTCNIFHRVNAITLHTSPMKESKDINQSGVVLTFITEAVGSATHCGVINPGLFNVNQENFLESLRFNSCLNKKISVDVDGHVKNCPSMSTTYGHVSDTSFREVVLQEDFRKLWGVTKDAVHICQHCEFRYICTDCRVYTQDLDVAYNKPLKCGYDPFQAKWDAAAQNSTL